MARKSMKDVWKRHNYRKARFNRRKGGPKTPKKSGSPPPTVSIFDKLSLAEPKPPVQVEAPSEGSLEAIDDFEQGLLTAVDARKAVGALATVFGPVDTQRKPRKAPPRFAYGPCPYCAEREAVVSEETADAPRSLFRIVQTCSRHCKLCDFWGESEALLAEHTRAAHRYHCVACKLTFEQQDQLTEHNDLKHTTWHVCQMCQVAFRSASAYARHENTNLHNKLIEVTANAFRCLSDTWNLGLLVPHVEPTPPTRFGAARAIPAALRDGSGRGVIVHDVLDRIRAAGPKPPVDAPAAVAAAAPIAPLPVAEQPMSYANPPESSISAYSDFFSEWWSLAQL